MSRRRDRSGINDKGKDHKEEEKNDKKGDSGKENSSETIKARSDKEVLGKKICAGEEKQKGASFSTSEGYNERPGFSLPFKKRFSDHLKSLEDDNDDDDDENCNDVVPESDPPIHSSEVVAEDGKESVLTWSRRKKRTERYDVASPTNSAKPSNLGLNDKGKGVGKEEEKGEQDDSEKATMKGSSDEEVFEKKNGGSGTDEEEQKDASFSTNEGYHQRPRFSLPFKKRLPDHLKSIEDDNDDENCNDVVPESDQPSHSSDVVAEDDKESVPTWSRRKKRTERYVVAPPNNSASLEDDNDNDDDDDDDDDDGDENYNDVVPESDQPSHSSDVVAEDGKASVPTSSRRKKRTERYVVASPTNSAKPSKAKGPRFLFEKALTLRDVKGRSPKLAIPRKDAVHFPALETQEKNSDQAILQTVDDQNESLEMELSISNDKDYRITEGWKEFVKKHNLQVKDVVRFYRSARGKNIKYLIKCERAKQD